MSLLEYLKWYENTGKPLSYINVNNLPLENEKEYKEQYNKRHLILKIKYTIEKKK